MKYFMLFIVLLPLQLLAQLQLAPVFSSNMVLQRDQPVHIWGVAKPGERIVVSFYNQQFQAIAGGDSSWSITLQKYTADHQSQQLTVCSAGETIMLKNILIGDVWVCIGQSNMEWPMQSELHYKEQTGKAQLPNLRFFNPTYAGKNIYAAVFPDSIAKRLTAKDFYSGEWQSSDSNTFKNMSAVAWYFGKTVLSETDVPQGLINLSIGGAPLETFISVEAMKQHPLFSAKVKGDWLTNAAMPTWVKQRGKENVDDLEDAPSDALGKNHGYKPGFAFAAGIEPILQMPVKGILCYQGESNAQEIERVMEYNALQALLVEDYRAKWKIPELPFYYVQLSSIDSARYKSQLWPQFRNEQRRFMSLVKNTGMAVSSDIGDSGSVHPLNKKDVGERLAKWALHDMYKKKMLPSGPIPVKAVFRGGNVAVYFKYTGKELTTFNQAPLKGFTTNTDLHAAATIHRRKIIIKTNQRPHYVYYGWSPYTDANLMNAENLPASTFSLEVK
ncbi:sialate O-acetylesterase [Terrimonas sp.]|uniref:sialate O-acetylesterase n=1 Tax=Terrimonas sp. TaxID=1914338 RepID=UPI000D50DA36|nr:sialate O-acetylesterase [Terrimonas sp.]PVD52851.1 sialate O-acetylesterase [Terrimonas sp.]